MVMLKTTTVQINTMGTYFEKSARKKDPAIVHV